MRDWIRLALLTRLTKLVCPILRLANVLTMICLAIRCQVPQQALGWSFRAKMFMQQILEPHPDIVCLQEVNRYGTAACHTMQMNCLELLELNNTLCLELTVPPQATVAPHHN